MKYLPIHPAMIPFLKPGMYVHNLKSWKITRVLKNTNEIEGRTSVFDIKYFTESDLLQMRISTSDILKLHTFKGWVYIAKHKDYITTNAHSETQLTHKAMKASYTKPTLHSFTDGFQAFEQGMRLLFLSGSYRGQERIVTDEQAVLEMHSSLSYGIECDDSCFAYSVEWLANNTQLVNMSKEYLDAKHVEALIMNAERALLNRATQQLEVGDRVKHLACGHTGTIRHIQEQSLYAVTWDNPTKPPATFGKFDMHTSFKLLAVGKKDPLAVYTKHSFDRVSEPTSWLALDMDTGERIVASTEEGIKAKVALAISDNNEAEYQVFARVGAMKCEQTLKFIK